MSNEPSRAIVRAEALLAIEPFVSTEETRYYLKGVYIHPHPVQGAVLVATNGHIMAILHDPAGIASGPPQIWSVALNKPLKSMASHAQKQLPKHTDGSIWADLSWAYPQASMRVAWASTIHDVLEPIGSSLGDGGSITGKFVIDGTFPDYVRVMPPVPEPDKVIEPHAYQGGYLTIAAKLAHALDAMNGVGGSHSSPVCIVPTDSGGPAWVRFNESTSDDAVSGVMVIMPIRADIKQPREIPRWLEQIKKARAEADAKLEAKRAKAA